jgi:hypothetical protein
MARTFCSVSRACTTSWRKPEVSPDVAAPMSDVAAASGLSTSMFCRRSTSWK